MGTGSDGKNPENHAVNPLEKLILHFLFPSHRLTTLVQYHVTECLEVATRVNAVHESGKAFEIVESVPFWMADRVLWRVVVKVDDRQYVGTAEAKLDAAKNTPDGTNPFECAETSALGRALALSLIHI